MSDPAASNKCGLEALFAHHGVRQRGHIRRAQLLEAGVAPRTIANQVAPGRLIPEHAGVYAIGCRHIEPRNRAPCRLPERSRTPGR